jgi:hypothetical protein
LPLLLARLSREIGRATKVVSDHSAEHPKRDCGEEISAPPADGVANERANRRAAGSAEHLTRPHTGAVAVSGTAAEGGAERDERRNRGEATEKPYPPEEKSDVAHGNPPIAR